MAPRIPTTIPCDSATTLEHELISIRSTLVLPETEESWDKIAGGVSRLIALCRGGACDFPTSLVSAIRELSRPLTTSLSSERSRLSGTAIDLVGVMAAGLSLSFEPLLPIFLPTILTLCTKPNKLAVTRARACLSTIIDSTRLPAILPFLLGAVKDKSASLRLTATESVLACMNCFNPPDLEREARARDIEAVIRTTATDASADVRKASRRVFEAYKIVLPLRVDQFTAPLTPTTRKYLDVQVKPISNHQAPTTSRPQSALSSRSGDVVREHRKPLSSSVRAAPSISRPTMHVRCQSSTTLLPSSNDRSVDPRGGSTTDGGPLIYNELMPPPPAVPSRPPQPPRRVEAGARRIAPSSSRDNDPTTQSSMTDGSTHPLSKSGLAQRPQAPALPGSSTGPTRASANLQPIPSAAGAKRPPATNIPNTKTGDLAAVDIAERQASGPRRVPRPIDMDCDAAKSHPTISTDGSTQTKPLKPAPAPVALIKGQGTTSKCIEVATTSKPANSVKPPTSAFASSGTSHSQIPTGITARKGKLASKMEANRMGGITKPTASQLQRMKSIGVEKRQGERLAVKPTWGRSAVPKSSSGGGSVTVSRKKAKPLPVTVPVEPSVLEKDESDLNPEAVPLPPSPSPPIAASIVSGDTWDEQEHQALENVEESTGSDDKAEFRTPDLPPTPVAQDPAVVHTPRPETTGERDVWFKNEVDDSLVRTPISALVSSIERGFLFTPCSPLSPPEHYAARFCDNSADRTISASETQANGEGGLLFGVLQSRPLISEESRGAVGYPNICAGDGEVGRAALLDVNL
ncbi:hypothetical protein JAAARDRAFT_193867 [Jaapia argillacea MUCL 33604]|uniref:TOG domain-containing protein n=1 Tax=Jaapia argillacea MUCL 33604 TaxID=933084 RepID=A0A067Q251_9AGAM|nr:hypothetical protein JAAARDRAFT_193867 [Jaapia argillacea MUCL 33604]